MTEESLQALTQRLEQASTHREKITSLNALARYHRRTDIQQAILFSEQAYDLAESVALQSEFPQGLADSLNNLAECYVLIGRYDQALRSATQALSLFQEISDLVGQSQALNTLGAIYRGLGDYSTALDFQLKKLILNEKDGNQQERASTLNMIGETYSLFGDYNRAVKFYQQSLQVFRELGDVAGEARVLNSCCVDYGHLSKYDQAIESGQESLHLFQKQGDDYGEGRALSSLGEVYSVQGQYHKASQLLFTALGKLQPRIGSRSSIEIIETLINIGHVYNQKHEFRKAIAYLQQALEAANKAEMKPSQYQCHQALAEAYERLGNFKEALQHFRQFNQIKDQVFNEQSDQRLKTLEVQHQTQQALADAENQRQLREDDRQYFERLSRMKDDFINTASHDLKSPLSAMMATIFLLHKHGQIRDQKGQRYISQIEAQVAQMRALIVDLLDLARLETGRALELENFALSPFLKTIQEDFEPNSESKQIHLELTIHTPDLIVCVDSFQIRRVLNNLLSNALKYTPEGGKITLIADQQGENLILQVADSGLGIPEKDIPHLFDRFYRVQKEEHLAVEGSGLGLAIVKAIVEQHKGQITVQSTLGKGTIFTLTLPTNLHIEP